MRTPGFRPNCREDCAGWPGDLAGASCFRPNRCLRERLFPARVIAPCSLAHIKMGDLVAGIAECPHSPQASTNFVAWDLPEVPMLERTHGPQLPTWWEIVLGPKFVAELPQLGGYHFRTCPNNSSLPALRFGLPKSDFPHFRLDCTQNTVKAIPAPLDPPPKMTTKSIAPAPRFKAAPTIPEEGTFDQEPVLSPSAIISVPIPDRGGGWPSVATFAPPTRGFAL